MRKELIATQSKKIKYNIELNSKIVSNSKFIFVHDIYSSLCCVSYVDAISILIVHEIFLHLNHLYTNEETWKNLQDIIYQKK